MPANLNPGPSRNPSPGPSPGPGPSPSPSPYPSPSPSPSLSLTPRPILAESAERANPWRRTERLRTETSAAKALHRTPCADAHIYRDGTCPTHAPSHLPLMLLYYCSTLHATHTRLEGAVVGECTDSCSPCSPSLIPERGCRSFSIDVSLSLSLARSHLLAGPCYLELLRAVTPPLVLVE